MTQPYPDKDILTGLTSAGAKQAVLVDSDGVLSVREQSPGGTRHTAQELVFPVAIPAGGAEILASEEKTSSIADCRDYAPTKTLLIYIAGSGADINLYMQGSLTGGEADTWYNYCNTTDGERTKLLDAATCDIPAAGRYLAIPITFRAPYIRFVASNADGSVATTAFTIQVVSGSV